MKKNNKKKPVFNQEMQIRGANRRLFARSPLVRDKLEESRQEFPRYKKDGSRAKKNWVKRQCEKCNKWVSSTKISIDHIDPVVPPEGFPPEYDMWERITLFLKRLWCDPSNLQRLCDDCHKEKTQKENIARLLKKYMEELDHLTETIQNTKYDKKATTKSLNKYITKKKTPGFQSVVQRAQELKNKIKNIKE